MSTVKYAMLNLLFLIALPWMMIVLAAMLAWDWITGRLD